MRKLQSSGGPQRILYFFAVFLLVIVWCYAFVAYFKHYDSIHPQVVWATPWLETEVVSVDGILLWNEVLLFAPRSGTVLFPHGTDPLRVAKGSRVARISAGGQLLDIKAPESGYFIGGSDGEENKWKYMQLWSGMQTLPAPKKVTYYKDGTACKQGQLIGKIVLQPQLLRFIGYVDLTAKMQAHLERGELRVKLDEDDTPSKAEIRVYEEYGPKAKIYLNLPWFPPDKIISRNYKLLVEMGHTRGLAVPEKAVVVKNNKQGVFFLKGTNSTFCPVRGQPISGGRFLVTEGLNVGDAIIADATNAREGRVQLW